MPRVLFLLILCCFVGNRSAIAQGYQEVLVPFYTESIKIAYSTSMLEVAVPEIKDELLVGYFEELSKTNYGTYINSIRQIGKVFQLNDWLTYQLVRESLQSIDTKASNAKVELLSWFILSNLGFDTRLAYLEENIFLFVHTIDEVFESPMIEDHGRPFINLTSINRGSAQQQALYLLNYHPNPEGRPFSFDLTKLPSFRPAEKEVKVQFNAGGEPATMTLKVDENIKKLMASYPIIKEEAYMSIPFSAPLASSLLPELQKRIEQKSEWEAVSIIASFTRSAFQYKDDKDFFGCSKPMAAEEVLLHPYSDCEDRSALFYRLVEELLELPMVVIAYPDHLTIGVALPAIQPGAFYHKGKTYYICDPTGPVNSTKIGVVPQGYEHKPFRILMASE